MSTAPPIDSLNPPPSAQSTSTHSSTPKSTPPQPSQSTRSTTNSSALPSSPTSSKHPNLPSPTPSAHSALLTHLHSLGTSHTAPLAVRARAINSASTSLASQTNLLNSQTSSLKKQGDDLEKVAEEYGGKLKEIGDVQNWAECIERELLVLEECLRSAEEREGEAG